MAESGKRGEAILMPRRWSRCRCWHNKYGYGYETRGVLVVVLVVADVSGEEGMVEGI
jgi:hypothetical protein